MRHPGSVWTASALAAVLSAERAAGHVDPLPTPEATWPDVVEAILTHRVQVPLAPHLGALGMPEPYRGRIAAAQRRTLQRGIAEIRDTRFVSELLADAGIDHLVVKGVSLGAVVGGLPALRGGGDVDVWVPETRAADVELLARVHGWERRPNAERLPEPADTWRWRTVLRFGHELPLDHHDRATLDLHWRLAEHQGELGFDFPQAYRRSVHVASVGPTVRTLCLDDALVHVAQHGRKEAWPTLRHLLDVVRLADAVGPATTRRLAHEHRNVALALCTASHTAPWLEDLVEPIDRRVRALADEAWEGCLSLEFPLLVRRAATGRESLRIRRRYESWLARSAPDWTSRGSWALHLLVPIRPLVDPDPPVISLPRAALHQVRQLIGR